MKIFCSGIGGIGLSSYAAHQNANGHDVKGSDRTETDVVKDLRKQGVKVTLQQDGSALSEDTELFVYTLALPADHPEKLQAEKLGIPCKTYFEALGELTSNHTLIAVCGTHGKSSTTAMAAKALIDGRMDPSVTIGTKMVDMRDRNWRTGHSEYFLVEACEYQRSFLHLNPNVVLLTNVTGDHFDAFDGPDDYRAAFSEFLAKIPKHGVLITHCFDPSLKEYVEAAKERGVIVVDADGYEYPNLKVPGKHQQENAQLVMALADILEIPNAERSLKQYRGCWRRSEVRGYRKGALIMDDYGHHPNEVRTTLLGLKHAHSDRRLVCVFQPHTHDRTLKLYDEFLESFAPADLVIIPNIYAARTDRDSAQVDLQKFVNEIEEVTGVQTINGQSLEHTAELLKTEIMQKGDLVVTMGAGDVRKVGDELMKLGLHAPLCTSLFSH